MAKTYNLQQIIELTYQTVEYTKWLDAKGVKQI